MTFSCQQTHEEFKPGIDHDAFQHESDEGPNASEEDTVHDEGEIEGEDEDEDKSADEGEGETDEEDEDDEDEADATNGQVNSLEPEY